MNNKVEKKINQKTRLIKKIQQYINVQDSLEGTTNILTTLSQSQIQRILELVEKKVVEMRREDKRCISNVMLQTIVCKVKKEVFDKKNNI